MALDWGQNEPYRYPATKKYITLVHFTGGKRWLRTKEKISQLYDRVVEQFVENYLPLKELKTSNPLFYVAFQKE